MLDGIAQLKFLSDPDCGDDIIRLVAVNPAAAFTADNRDQRIQPEIRFDVKRWSLFSAFLNLSE